jgi:hypothetical protein
MPAFMLSNMALLGIVQVILEKTAERCYPD